MQALRWSFHRITLFKQVVEGCLAYRDYCLFTMSPSSPKTVNANSTSLATGQAKGGGVVACSTATEGVDNLIATTTDNSDGIEWSNIDNTEIGVPAQSTTNGASNTTAIITQTGATTGAAFICSNLTTGGFTDWFLPARNQLNCLNTNKALIGNFSTTAFYWSSTERDKNEADYQSFEDDTQGFTDKASENRVRCVRNFTP